MARIFDDHTASQGFAEPVLHTASEEFVYDFLMKEIPDYIYAGFYINIDEVEMDTVLLIPHIGIFVLEIYGYPRLTAENGVLYAENKKGARHIWRPSAQKEKYFLKKYIKEHYDLTPLIYEISCFPHLTSVPDADLTPFGLDPDHILWARDFENGYTFMNKIFNYYTGCMLQPKRNEMPYFDDLNDDLIITIAHNWGAVIETPPRPGNPPMIFISYNNHNQPIAKALQIEIEKRGVFAWMFPKDIPIGGDYREHEMATIPNCTAFLIILSPSSQESEEVLFEFDYALRSGKKILPLLYGIKEPNKEWKEKLSNIEWREISDTIEVSLIDEIIETLKQP